MRGDDGIDDLHDELLASARQLGDAVHLLLQFGHRAALGGGFGVVFEQGFDGDAEALGDGGQQRHRHATSASLVGVERLLRHADQFGELDLGDVLVFAQAADAGAEGDEEGAFVVGDGHGVIGQLEGTPEQAEEVKGLIGVQGEKEVSRGEGGTAKVGTLPDGSKVIDYPSGGGDSYPKGTRTIEIQRPKGSANEKWRFPEPKAPTT